MANFFGSELPTTGDAGDTTSVNVGLEFTVGVPGWVTGIRFYKHAANVGTHTGALWYGGHSETAIQIGACTFAGETASGWQEQLFASPVPVIPVQTYTASYHTAGHYSASAHYFDSPITRGDITGKLGLYYYAASDAQPINAFNNGNYYADLTFVTELPPSGAAPQSLHMGKRHHIRLR